MPTLDADGYRRAWDGCEPPRELDDKVMRRVRALREEEEVDMRVQMATAGAGMGAGVGRAAVRGVVLGGAGRGVTRRGFVAAGLAACLGVGAVGVGLMAAREALMGGASGAPAGSGQDSDGCGSVSAAAPVAQNVSPVAFGVSARANTLLPIGSEISHSLSLLANFACAADEGAAEVASVTYTFAGGRTSTASRPDGTTYEVPTVAPVQVDDPRADAAAVDAHAAEVTDGSGSTDLYAVPDTSFSVDYAQTPDWDGVEHTGQLDVYRALGVGFVDGFWASDPVLQAKHAWLSENVKPVGERTADPDTLYGLYLDVFAQVASSYDSLCAWLKSCHANVFELAAEELAPVTMTAEARLSDGTSARRVYRIERAEGFDEAVGERFDALLERYGLPDEAWSAAAAPFFVFGDYVPDEDEQDARLSRPLFRLVAADGGDAEA